MWLVYVTLPVVSCRIIAIDPLPTGSPNRMRLVCPTLLVARLPAGGVRATPTGRQFRLEPVKLELLVACSWIVAIRPLATGSHSPISVALIELPVATTPARDTPALLQRAVLRSATCA